MKELQAHSLQDWETWQLKEYSLFSKCNWESLLIKYITSGATTIVNILKWKNKRKQMQELMWLLIAVEFYLHILPPIYIQAES